MTGKELFEYDGYSTGFNLTDFWSFQYSNIYSLHGEIAEFVVARALGITEAQNSAYWTLWDITYRNIRIEVKATAYYHLWNENGKVSNQRTFGITKANGSYDPNVCGNEEFCRQNDIYVFCLNTGTTKESSNPMNLNNWEFYIVPTSFINEYCGDNKSISLGRIKGFGFEAKKYNEIRAEIDSIIDTLSKR
jgi:hypothetical protein